MAGTPDPAIGDPGAAPVRRSIADTWTEVVADAGGLVRAEAQLARTETADNLKAVGRETAKMAVGGVLLVLALVFLTVALVVALAKLVGMLWSLLIVAGLCIGIGLLLLLKGKGKLAAQNILPEQSLHRMSRDLERLSARAAPPLPTATVKEQ